MAWNEPGGKDKDPWGGGNRGGDGPPDLDEIMRGFQNRLRGIFGGGKGGDGGPGQGRGPSGFLIIAILVIALVVYAAMGFYQVNEQERAVVLRFGTYETTKGSGLRWNFPLVDKVFVERVTRVREWSTSEQMLTKDLNIVDIQISVQYTIGDLRNFVLKVKSPENSLHQATNSALRHVAGSTVMHEILTQGREQVAVDVQQRLQAYLDTYQTGIRVETVNIEEAQPPDEVQDAFDDVIRAREDEERLKNEAQAYANGIIPVARGEAQRAIEEASAYKSRVIAEAEGDASRFESLLTEYTKSPEVTRKRLYLDAMQDIMSQSSKVMVDVEGGNNVLYLPLDKIVQGARSATSGEDSLTPAQLDELSNRIAEQLRREQRSNNVRRGEVR